MAITVETSENLQGTLLQHAMAGNSNTLSARCEERSFWRRETFPKKTGQSYAEAYLKHLQKRKSPQLLEQLSETRSPVLCWGLDLEVFGQQTRDLIKLLETAVKDNSKLSIARATEVLSAWSSGSNSPPQSPEFALECLAIAHALSRLVNVVSTDCWWSLLDAVYRFADSGLKWQENLDQPAEQAFAQQLLAAELPFTLAYLFPEMALLKKLRAPAQENFVAGMEELLNGNGLLHGNLLRLQRPLVACWTRCRLMAEHQKKSSLSRAVVKQYQWLVCHSIGLSSATGHPMLAGEQNRPWSADFLRTMLRLGGSAADVTAALDTLPKKLTAPLGGKSGKFVPETSEHCEWSSVAYLRTEWQRKAPVVAVHFGHATLELEVWLGTQRLFAGAVPTETKIEGRTLAPVGTWEETCWFSDEDVDYLELSLDLEQDVRIERQILLARDELFLLVADQVMNADGGLIAHRMGLPLDEQVRFEPTEETREGFLISEKTLARVLPLALPEWRVDPRIGHLQQEDRHLVLQQERPGKNLSCPLLIDLHTSRGKKECTWRQLTVAESLEIQPHDVAVGYRAQCGKHQWLYYRSLAPAANRTILGQNLASECLVGRFLASSGEVDELLEIEA